MWNVLGWNEDKQILAIVNNLIKNNNHLSTSYMNYTSYLYYVFPLHLNTFNRLFGDVIHPKVLKLTNSVTKFISLTGDISYFTFSLNDLSSYLINFNPSESLFNLIKKFKSQSHVDGVKLHIEELINLLSDKMKYDQIIGHVQSIRSRVISMLNINLKTKFENFKTKIEEHKASLEQDIKQYIFSIRFDLSYAILPVISKLISDINNLEANKRKLSQFNKYTTEYELLKECRKWEEVKTPFKKIFETHEKYKKCLEKSCSEIKCELNEFKQKLKYYQGSVMYARNSLYKYNDSISDSSDIDKLVKYLKSLNSKYVKIDNYISCVQKLQEIGSKINEHIKTMKSALEKVKDKVKPEVKTYIEGLKPINIKKEDVQKIKTIKGVNKSIIGKLQIAKHTIQFYRSLEGELGKLNVDFNDYDFTLHLTVKQKLSSFESQIKNAINKIESDMKGIKDHEVVMDSDTYKESYYENLVKPVESFIDVILSLIDLECAIEGVARNFIQCSLQSLTSYVETPGNQNVPV